MMARYFYAYRWTYGIGKKWDDGSWPGYLMVFDSRAERDAWVADDVFDGNWHREAITAAVRACGDPRTAEATLR